MHLVLVSTVDDVVHRADISRVCKGTGSGEATLLEIFIAPTHIVSLQLLDGGLCLLAATPLEVLAPAIGGVSWLRSLLVDTKTFATIEKILGISLIIIGIVTQLSIVGVSLVGGLLLLRWCFLSPL